jgi:ABC-type glycerol-3-phosphate transport system permease component
MIQPASDVSPLILSRSLDRRRRVRRSLRRSAGDGLAIVILTVGLGFVFLPFLWLVSTAFKDQVDAFALPPKVFFAPTLANFSILFTGTFVRYEINSIVITLLATCVALGLGIPAGWALSLGGRAAEFMGAWLLATYIIPGVVFIVPMFLLFSQLGLTNTYLGIVLGYETGLLPFTVWMMRSYFADLPVELEDAARVDGASRFQALLRVILPISVTGISTVTILVAIGAWSEYFGTLILGGSSTFTATVGIYTLINSVSNDFGHLAAAVLFIVVPILVATVLAQRGLLRGLTGAAVKG